MKKKYFKPEVLTLTMSLTRVIMDPSQPPVPSPTGTGSDMGTAPKRLYM